MFADGPDVFLQDNLLRRRGTDDLAEPAQVSGTPVGPTCLADIVSQEKRLETDLGALEILEGIFTCPAQVANSFVLALGNIDGREIPRAQQPGELHSIAAVGFDTVTGLLGNQGGCHDRAARAFFHQIPGEPVATGASLIDKEQVVAF
jgi:hypothetical protein